MGDIGAWQARAIEYGRLLATISRIVDRVPSDPHALAALAAQVGRINGVGAAYLPVDQIEDIRSLLHGAGYHGGQISAADGVPIPRPHRDCAVCARAVRDG